MATISAEQDVVTLINVFTVEPEDQERLLEALAEGTEKVISKMPGFVSANLHKSLDGTKVTNYAQWRSREDYAAMLEHPEAGPHMREAAGIAASFEPYLYEVSFAEEMSGGA